MIFTKALTMMFLAAFSVSVSASKHESFKAILDQASQQIKLNHLEFSQQTSDLQNAASSLCLNPTQDLLDAAQRQWRTTMDAWMAVSVLQFGPLQTNDRRLQIQAWPMRPQLLNRQIKGLVVQNEPVTLETVKTSSVALQGLPALEVFFYQPDALASLSKGQTCQAINAISTHVHNLANQLRDSWVGEYGLAFSHPDNDADQVVNYLDEYLNGLVTALQQIQRRKLNDPLGLSGKRARLSELESYLSKTSLDNIRANLTAVIAYLRGSVTPVSSAGESGFGIDDFLQTYDPEGGTIIFLTDQLTTIETTLAKLKQPLETFFDDAAFADKVRELHQQVSQLQRIVEKQVFADLGITRDFNSEDGD